MKSNIKFYRFINYLQTVKKGVGLILCTRRFKKHKIAGLIIGCYFGISPLLMLFHLGHHSFDTAQKNATEEVVVTAEEQLHCQFCANFFTQLLDVPTEITFRIDNFSFHFFENHSAPIYVQFYQFANLRGPPKALPSFKIEYSLIKQMKS